MEKRKNTLPTEPVHFSGNLAEYQGVTSPFSFTIFPPEPGIGSESKCRVEYHFSKIKKSRIYGEDDHQAFDLALNIIEQVLPHENIVFGKATTDSEECPVELYQRQSACWRKLTKFHALKYIEAGDMVIVDGHFKGQVAYSTISNTWLDSFQKPEWSAPEYKGVMVIDDDAGLILYGYDKLKSGGTRIEIASRD